MKSTPPPALCGYNDLSSPLSPAHLCLREKGQGLISRSLKTALLPAVCKQSPSFSDTEMRGKRQQGKNRTPQANTAECLNASQPALLHGPLPPAEAEGAADPTAGFQGLPPRPPAPTATSAGLFPHCPLPPSSPVRFSKCPPSWAPLSGSLRFEALAGLRGG